MNISVKELVGKEYVDKACSFTVNKEVHPSLAKLYKAEHSPIRCKIFWIEMIGIPTFASVHFVRHNVGVSHFVKSNREDRSSFTGDLGRETPVNHAMLINAQELINISRKRLCNQSHVVTKKIMRYIREAIRDIDPDLADRMIPDCIYRGECCEIKPCGKPVDEE